MTGQDFNKVVEQLKAEGYDEKAILGSFYRMFQEDEITLDELEGMVTLMGYHLTEEFKAMSPEDQKTKGVRETDDKEDLPEGMTDGGKEFNEDEAEAEDDDDDDSEEEKKAMKLFGQN